MNSRTASYISLIFVGCCLLSSARLVVQAPKPGAIQAQSGEIPNRSDRRFAELRRMLPARGVVGYYGDSSTSPDSTAAYYLTQYALAPLVVDHSLRHRWVVGNFPDASPPMALPAELELVKDFGNGVLLFATKDTD